MTNEEPPRRWALVTAAAIGLIGGAVVAVGALALLRSDSAPPPELAVASTTTTVEAAPIVPAWVHPREVVIGSTALVPTDLEVESGELVLSYELVSIAPGGEETTEGGEQPEQVFPTTWTVATSAGDFQGTTGTVDARRARFEVPEELAVSDIRGIRLDAYRVPVPFSFPMPISPADTTPHAIVPGITARVESVLEQRDNSIVTVRLTADDGFLVSDIVVTGIGPEWVRASRSQLGSPSWTLDYRGEQLPDPMPLRAHGLLWSLIERPMDVDITGLGE